MGARRPGFTDFYHWLMRLPWPALLALIGTAYVTVSLVFACLYMAVGGIANADPHNFLDHFFFSVQTVGTMGSAAMYPTTRAANAVVTLQSMFGLFMTALSTGLVFIRFSLVKARIVFGQKATIGPMDGIPTLMIRLGNDRSNQIHDAHMRVTLMTAGITKEGSKWYRSVDLELVRDRASALARSWTILHQVTERSPLHGMTPETLKAREAELYVTVSGTDDTSMQTVHARHVYEHFSIVFGAKLADILTDLANGDLRLDLTKFHAVIPTEPLPSFPYGAPR